MAGAHIINDIRSLTEPGALQAAAETGLPVCLMHMQGQPKTMQEAPKYEDVFADVERFLMSTLCAANRQGSQKKNCCSTRDSVSVKISPTITNCWPGLGEFHHFGLPLLVGMSRKSMVGQLLNVGPSERLNGSPACAVIAAMQGAQIIRVHDVKETVEALRVVEATLAAKGKKRYE